MSKSWYSRSQDIEYKDGRIGKEYHFVFETTDKELASRIEKIFHNIMDGIEPEPQWNNHTVACLLADLYGDTCACNYNNKHYYFCGYNCSQKWKREKGLIK